MNNLVKLLIRFHFFLIFFVFEAFALYLAVSNNTQRSESVLNSANSFTGAVHEWTSSYVEYFSLKDENEKLTGNYVALFDAMPTNYRIDTLGFYFRDDSLDYQRQFRFKTAKVINNSVYRQKNYLTINKGMLQGIESEMVVISPSGVVGIVTSVSENYSLVISLLNTQIGISAKFKKNDYFGSVQWDGKNYLQAKLFGIPNHVEIAQNDTIVTSGFSAIFPVGVAIGTVESFSKNGGDNFYNITINLSSDFKNISNVFVIENVMKKEQVELESTVEK